MTVRFVVTLLVAAALLPACRPPAPSPPRHVVGVTRPVGSWQGRGHSTIGFPSDSGRFRITWEARNERPRGTGTLRLTVHSAVSGRPLQIVVDHHGEGAGRAEFADDPRSYNVIVESANVDWAFTVDEVIGVYANESSPAPSGTRQ